MPPWSSPWFGPPCGRLFRTQGSTAGAPAGLPRGRLSAGRAADPMSAAGFRKQLAVIGWRPIPHSPAGCAMSADSHSPMANRNPGHPGVARAPQHPAHQQVHRAHQPVLWTPAAATKPKLGRMISARVPLEGKRPAGTPAGLRVIATAEKRLGRLPGLLRSRCDRRYHGLGDLKIALRELRRPVQTAA